MLTTINAFLTGVRARVNGWSMYPVLAPGEGVLFRRYGEPAVGDIALARDPRDGRYLIKRIAEITEPDEYVLLGENPEFSTDSREFGPVSRMQLVGRGWLVYWPPNRARRLL